MGALAAKDKQRMRETLERIIDKEPEAFDLRAWAMDAGGAAPEAPAKPSKADPGEALDRCVADWNAKQPNARAAALTALAAAAPEAFDLSSWAKRRLGAEFPMTDKELKQMLQGRSYDSVVEALISRNPPAAVVAAAAKSKELRDYCAKKGEEARTFAKKGLMIENWVLAGRQAKDNEGFWAELSVNGIATSTDDKSVTGVIVGATTVTKANAAGFIRDQFSRAIVPDSKEQLERASRRRCARDPDERHTAQRPMTGSIPATVATIPPEGAARLAASLFDPARKLPVVAVTSSHLESDESWIDPAALAEALGGLAEVVFLRTGEATFALEDQLPEKLGVFGGHLRIWWPGLREDAYIYDHPLIWVYDKAQADDAFARIVDEVTAFDERRRGESGAAAAPVEGQEVRGMVAGFERRGAWLSVGAWKGLIPSDQIVAGAELDAAEVLRIGMSLRARVTRVQQPGPRVSLSAAACLPPLWELARRRIASGDRLRARVESVGNLDATLSVLPGVQGHLPIERMGQGVVHPSRVLEAGRTVQVQVDEIGEDQGGLVLSLIREGDPAGMPPARPLALLPGGLPFLADPPEVRPKTPERAAPELERLRADLAQAEQELAEARRLLKEQSAEVRKSREAARAARREAEALGARVAALELQLFGGSDPLSGAEAFARAVTLFWERTYTDDDRRRYPLQRFVVGPKFLESARPLQGIDVLRIVDVCARVASGRENALPGGDVKRLLAGRAGRPIERARDGAKAWRGALQVNSPSARRLHWWALPGGGVEFAKVGLHDEFDIPE
jgi:hypothetical protein